jgi:hypothetical protein
MTPPITPAYKGAPQSPVDVPRDRAEQELIESIKRVIARDAGAVDPEAEFSLEMTPCQQKVALLVAVVAAVALLGHFVVKRL